MASLTITQQSRSFGATPVLRDVTLAEIDERVSDTAPPLGLTPLLARRPAQLSGGQRQRQRVAVALVGRARVREPRLVALHLGDSERVPGSQEPPQHAVVLADAHSTLVHPHNCADRAARFVL